jgi:hypothetical protein
VNRFRKSFFTRKSFRRPNRFNRARGYSSPPR